MKTTILINSTSVIFMSLVYVQPSDNYYFDLELSDEGEGRGFFFIYLVIKEL